MKQTKMDEHRLRIHVCGGPRCSKRKSADVREAFSKELGRRGLLAEVKVSKPVPTCLTLCEHGPNVMIYPESTWYCGVNPKDVPEIIEQHVVGCQVVGRLKGTDPWDIDF